MRLALLAGVQPGFAGEAPDRAATGERVRRNDMESGFNQYRQAILDPFSGLYQEKVDAILLYLDVPICLPAGLRIPMTIRSRKFLQSWRPRGRMLLHLLETIAARLPSATVFLNTLYYADIGGTYRGLEYNSGFSFRQIVASYNDALRELARGSSNVVVVDVEALVMEAGAERWSDPRLWYLGRIPLSAHAHGLLAKNTQIILRHGGELFANASCWTWITRSGAESSGKTE